MWTSNLFCLLFKEHYHSFNNVCISPKFIVPVKYKKTNSKISWYTENIKRKNIIKIISWDIIQVYINITKWNNIKQSRPRVTTIQQGTKQRINFQYHKIVMQFGSKCTLVMEVRTSCNKKRKRKNRASLFINPKTFLGGTTTVLVWTLTLYPQTRLPRRSTPNINYYCTQ